MLDNTLVGAMIGFSTLVATSIENLQGITTVDFFRTVFKELPIPMAVVDIEGRPYLLNHAAETFFEYTQDELRRKTFSEFTHPEDINTDELLFKQIMDGTRDHYGITKRWITKTGKTVWGGLSVVPLRSDVGDMIGVVALVTPIRVQHPNEKPAEAPKNKLSPLPKKSDNFAIVALKELAMMPHPYKAVGALCVLLMAFWMFVGDGAEQLIELVKYFSNR